MTRRRDFVRALVLGASTGLVAGAPMPVAEEPAPDPIEAEIDARMAILLARYGDRLDDEARQSVRREVAGIVRRARALRQFPLDDGDGPATVWIPYRGPIA